ncbi:MAG: MBL fold metallo-hydrolase [Verrucomicrobiales bacterium]
MLELAVLGSGSSGNSALVCLGDTRILIDAGLSARQLCVRLQELGIDPDSLSAIVLTHEHGDHARGIDVFCRKRSIPVYGTPHTCAMVKEKVRADVVWHHFEAGAAFRIGEVAVESFSVPHDAVDPVGFVFDCGRSRVGVLSDLGHVTRMIVERLKGVDTLFTEANYDEAMLQNDVRRPWPTKQRIGNRHGHLSNDQTAALIAEIAGPNLNQVILGHLSSDCNCPTLASSLIAQTLRESGFPEVVVECADRNRPLPLRRAAHDSVHRSRLSEEKAPESGRVGESEPPLASSPSSPKWRQGEWAF